MHSWVDLGSIFTPNLPRKVHTIPLGIDAKMPSHLVSHRFVITSNPQHQCFSYGKTHCFFFHFFNKSLFGVGIDVCSILVPKCFHFSSTNPPTSFQTSIDFCIDCSSIVLRMWKPTWSHNGTFSLKIRRGYFRERWLCWVCLLFRLSGRPGPLLAPSGLDLGRFGPPFWRFLVPIFFTISKFFAPPFSATLTLC